MDLMFATVWAILNSTKIQYALAARTVDNNSTTIGNFERELVWYWMSDANIWSISASYFSTSVKENLYLHHYVFGYRDTASRRLLSSSITSEATLGNIDHGSPVIVNLRLISSPVGQHWLWSFIESCWFKWCRGHLWGGNEYMSSFNPKVLIIDANSLQWRELWAWAI